MNLEVVKFNDSKYFSSIRTKLESKKFSLQFLPESLEDFSKIKNFNFKNKKLKSSYIIDIIHNLILKYYFKKENKFNIMSTILKEKYGHLYNYYIDYLVATNVIEMVSNYKSGRNARVYKLNDRILKDKINRYKNFDNILLKKYKNAVSQIEENGIKNKLIDDDIKTKLVNDLFHIDIQFDRSIFYLDNLKDRVSDIYHRNKYSVECINDKHIFYHFDSYGRLHSNFTILKSFIRKNCLLINGSETCEIDISNSQPLFLSKLIKDSKSRWVDNDEIELFNYLVRNGKYYQYLLNNLKIKDKKDAKELTYKVLFGKNYKNCKYSKMFGFLFPTILNFIKLYKKEKSDYKSLAYTLQRMESNFLFNILIRKIMIINSDIKIATVHDSIIIDVQYKNLVTDIFNTELDNHFN
jgi:hypothetical protein